MKYFVVVTEDSLKALVTGMANNLEDFAAKYAEYLHVNDYDLQPTKTEGYTSFHWEHGGIYYWHTIIEIDSEFQRVKERPNINFCTVCGKFK